MRGATKGEARRCRVMRTMDFSALAHPPLWLGALPPVWFASLEMVLLGRAGAPIYFVFAGLGVVFTVVTAWLGVARLADSYAAGLVALNEAGSNAGPRKQRGRWATLLLRIPLVSWWLRDPVERASFSLTLSQLGRSRGVKLRVYPQAAQFMIYPVIFFFGVGSSPGVNAFSLAFAGAFLAMLPSTIIEQLRSSEDWQAADVFFAAPIARASSLFHGVRKAVIVGLVAPGLVFVALIGLVGLRDPRLLVVLLPGLVALPLFSQLAGVGKSFVPFSQPPAKTNTTGRGCLIIVISLILSLAVAGLAGWAWLEHRLGLMLAIEIPIVFAVSLLMRRSMAGMTLRGEA